ncbi:MAG TPA: hypothetical protein VMW86_07750 [Dehalococcoidales bacterium]|nr:hypothetical protein [Dehalococcoidales bacterium]
MLCVVRPKACKRCGGDLSLECDIYGVYIECIQCGATWNQKDVTLAKIYDAVKALKARPIAPGRPPELTSTDRRSL